jgi:hypothetical protein
MNDQYMLEKKPANLIVAAVFIALGILFLIFVGRGEPLLPPRTGDTAATINVGFAVIMFTLAYFFLQPYLERALFGKLIDWVEHRRVRAMLKQAQAREAKTWMEVRVNKAGPVEQEEIGQGRQTEVVKRPDWMQQ